MTVQHRDLDAVLFVNDADLRTRLETLLAYREDRYSRVRHE